MTCAIEPALWIPTKNPKRYLLVHGKECSEGFNSDSRIPLYMIVVHTSRKSSYAHHLIQNVSSYFVAEKVPAPMTGDEALLHPKQT